MPKELQFSSLSTLRQGLARLCKSTNYGEIKNLPILDREPVLSDPQCVVLVDVKLDSEERPRREVAQSDFPLCSELVRLMGLFDTIQNGKISKIEVRDGIPRRVVWEKNYVTDFGGDSK